jgi:hypothetical protein
MPVRLNGSTSGYTELSAPAVAGNNTLTFPVSNGASGSVLSTNGAGILSWAAASVGASVQVFTANGTYTPTAGKTTFLVFATGGGGGYGYLVYDTQENLAVYGEGGGAGTALRLYTSTEMGSTAAITVGAAGANGSDSSGGTGGSTSFDPAGTGLTITGLGGAGGIVNYNPGAGPGSGGGSTNSLFAIDGIAGGGSFWAGGRGRYQTAGVVLILEW